MTAFLLFLTKLILSKLVYGPIQIAIANTQLSKGIIDCCGIGMQKTAENTAEQQQLIKHIWLEARATALCLCLTDLGKHIRLGFR